MKHVEDFQYATVLDLNMGYYTISILPEIQGMTTVVTGFGKWRYNRLLMGTCTLGDIFQEKLDKLIGYIEGVKTYIDDVLVLSKESLLKNMDQPRVIFDKMRATGLKVNAPKFSFGLTEITHIVYVITRERIKYDSKKLQGIMDIGRPALHS